MHVIDALRLGGAERMLVDIANATAADGHTASVSLTRDGRDLAHELRPNIHLWVLGRKKRFDWAALRHFASIVREERVDVLHVHGRTTFAFVALAKALGWVSTPILLHDHNGLIEIDSSVPLWFRLWGRHHVERYVGVYSRLAEWAVTAGVPRARTCAIGNAIALGRLEDAPPLNLRAAFGIAEHARIGIVVCGIRREKGVLQLLEALPGPCERHALRVILVGGEREAGHVAACKSKAVSLGLGQAVIFAGERPDVAQLMKGADFGVIPSLSESGPLVLIEMMAAGLPFVATLVGGIAHDVKTFGGAQFIPPGDAVAMADALDALLALSPERWKARVEAGRRVAREHFDVCDAMPEWYRMYRECLNVSTP